MDFALRLDGITADMDWQQAGTILNNVWLSLMTRRGSFFQNPDFGSRLHLLQREKNTATTERLAREYCLEALQWLIDVGRADAVDVITERDTTVDPYRLKLVVTVTQANRPDVTFELFLEVV